jgi:cell division septal protein FtsQ
MVARRMRRLVRPAVLALGLALACAAVWFGGPVLLRQVGFFRVRRVELVGVTASKPDEVVRAMKLPARGNVFDDLRPYAMRVLALPGIRSAWVHRRLPGTLVVEVTEASAVALSPRQGRLAMIGRNGKFLAFDPAVSAPDLPLVDRPDPVVARVLGRLQELDPELFSRIVTASQVRGDVVLDLGGRRLWLGPNVSAEVIRAVMAAEQVLGRQGRVWAELDGRFAGQVVVRWRAG